VCWLDAAWLREVLPGCYRYTELMALAADLCADLVQAEAGSSLPVEPEVAAVEALVVELHRRSLSDMCFILYY
jgi:hypothetical protein